MKIKIKEMKVYQNYKFVSNGKTYIIMKDNQNVLYRVKSTNGYASSTSYQRIKPLKDDLMVVEATSLDLIKFCK